MHSFNPQCFHSKEQYKQLYAVDVQSKSAKVYASGVHVESQGKYEVNVNNIHMSTDLLFSQRCELLQQVLNSDCPKCALDITQRAIEWLNAPGGNSTERAVLYLVTAYKIQKTCNGNLTALQKKLEEAFKKCECQGENNLLHHFIQYGYLPVVKYLLKQKEAPSWLEQKNAEGRLPIHIAIMTENTGIAKLLLQLSSAELLNTQDNEGNTSLHLAVKQAIKHKADREKFESVIKGLLGQNVDPKIKNCKGKRPLDLASSSLEVEQIFWSFNRPALLKQSLSEYYAKKKDLSLLIPQQAQNISIETIYTRLAIIGEREKKEKEKEVQEAIPGQSLTQLAHETIFAPKEAITLEELFDQNPLKTASEKRVLIQGPAGIGKSTLCHHIAYRWAKKELFQEFDYLFWLSLRRLNKDVYPPGQDSLANYLSTECDLDQTFVLDFLRDQKLQKKTLILLDGYDELSPEATNSKEENPYKILKQIQEFPNVIMTSRPQSINRFKRVCDLEILGFDNRGMKEYIAHFFPTESIEKRELRHYLKQHPLAKSLAHIPIHLEIFCSITAAGKLPSLTEAVTITGLYTILIEWLFRRFRCERGEKAQKAHTLLKNNPNLASEVKYKKEALEEIAWTGMENNKLAIDHSSVETILNGINEKYSLKIELSTEDLENIGLIKHENDDVWVFNHFTFQEYFAASKLANLYLKKDITQAAYILKEIKLKPQYQLVLSITAGLLSKEENSNGILQFFNDLYSEPRDLAKSYESDLIATCFAECETLENLSDRYNEFIRQTIENLESPIDDFKNFDIYILGKITKVGKGLPEAAIGSLVNLLNDSQASDDAKCFAIMALGEIAKAGKEFSEAATGSLVNLLNDSQASDNAKHFATKALGKIAKAGKELPEAAIGSLVNLLNDSQASNNAKRFAAAALGEIAKAGKELPEAAIDSLVNLLSESQASNNTKRFATEALGEIAKAGKELPEAAIDSLVNLLNDSQASDDAKCFATEVLVKIAKPEKELPEVAIGSLVNLLSDSQASDDAKRFAARALGEIAKAGKRPLEIAIDSLANLLNDSQASDDAKYFATRALGKIAKVGKGLSKAAIGSLVNLLNDSQTSDDAKFFAKALGKIAKAGKELPEATIGSLVNLLNDSQTSDDAKYFAAEALGKIAKAGKELPEATIGSLVNLLNDSQASNNAMCFAAVALGKIAKAGKELPEAAIGSLVNLLSDSQPSDDAKYFSTKALGKIAKAGQEPPEAAIGSLVNLLSDSQASDDAKYFATEALGEIAKAGKEFSEAAIGSLLDLLNEPQASDVAKGSAARALVGTAKAGKELPEAAIDSLVNLLNDSQASDYAKRFAAAALDKIAKAGKKLPEAAIGSLVNLLNDSLASDDAKYVANAALGEIAKAGQKLSKEAINGVFDFLKTQLYRAQYGAAEILSKAITTTEISSRMVDDLINFLNNPELTTFRQIFIENIDFANYTIDSKEKIELLKIICQLSKRALYKTEESYCIADQRGIFYLKTITRPIIDQFYFAVESGDMNILEISSKEYPGIIANCCQYGSPVHSAIAHNRLEVLKWLYEKDEQLFLNYCNTPERKPPFHLAAFLGHLEIGQWLVEIQPSLIHLKNDRGETPLDIIEGNTEFSEWLTSQGCKRQEESCVLM